MMQTIKRYKIASVALLCTVCSVDLMFGQSGECPRELGRLFERFEGEICACYEAPYSKTFGQGYVFELNPAGKGWVISVRKGSDDLSRLTPPLHGPNPRVIEGWHFRNRDNTGPNLGGLNFPGRIREFIFSPEVGEILRSGRYPTIDEVHRVERFGRGKLTVVDYGLSNLEEGRQARMVWLKFTVCLSWPQQNENGR